MHSVPEEAEVLGWVLREKEEFGSQVLVIEGREGEGFGLS